MRPWAVVPRNNATKRPMAVDLSTDGMKCVSDLAENHNPWTIFLEMLAPDSELEYLPVYDKASDVLLFFKFYDPRQQKMHYAGHYHCPANATIRKLFIFK